ncbi:2-enoyl thioester reductase domain-containing protein [Luteolibacter sp. GHJ8]|uniref:enoyl-[acyl-carrier-protein] reductase n=1 Tax=Luteolibacter rhizosphaerae TaxID=2989719 RepID=A0ABT3G0M0_9BACT|nr:2-enoyl thioester reductase domain-containing protein [Luteolibacter rhizosphaerae]MCW1913386.1 2-enoyl thioester reductase domain-containing protein [Luteolibacter rhizosphaerae]
MQALRFHQFGKPLEVLRLEELELPPLKQNEVCLKMLAAPVNPADLNLIEGTYGVKPPLPSTPGIEGCGEVVESTSPDFAPGDRAIILRRAGSWASHVQIDAASLFKLPSGLDPAQAAMLKVNPATAWRLLTGFGMPEKESWVVQNAANSAVGRCVIVLAKQLGLHTINLVRRAELVGELEALGADVVALDDDVAVAAHGDKAPVLAFNCVGGESALRLMNLLAPGGTHITFGAMARRPLNVPNGLLIFKNLNLRGLWITKWIEAASSEEIREVYGRLATSGLHMPVDRLVPLANYPEALEALASPERNGKVLLVP